MYTEADLIKLNKRASSFLNENRGAQAIALLKQVCTLASNPSSAVRLLTLTNLGDYYLTTGQPQLALKYSEQALTLRKATPKHSSVHARALLCQAYAQSRLGKHSEAAGTAQQAVSLLGQSHSNVAALVKAYRCLGNELQLSLKYVQALTAFHTGLCIAQDQLGQTHELTASLQGLYIVCKRLVNGPTPIPRAVLRNRRRSPTVRRRTPFAKKQHSLASASTARALSIS